MSTERLEELERRLDSIGKLLPLVRWLLAGAALVGAWSAVLQYQVAWVMQESKKHSAQIHAEELWRAETAGNRFTSGDQNKYAQTVAEWQAVLDKRATRLEDNYQAILLRLSKIDEKLEKQKP